MFIPSTSDAEQLVNLFDSQNKPIGHDEEGKRVVYDFHSAYLERAPVLNIYLQQYCNRNATLNIDQDVLRHQ